MITIPMGETNASSGWPLTSHGVTCTLMVNRYRYITVCNKINKVYL